MYLYFYEDNLIVGISYSCGTFFLPNFCEAGEFDVDDENSRKKYDAWSTEENDDGTFYLVFIFKQKKYYLTSEDSDCSKNVMVYLYEEKYIKEVLFDFYKIKMVYNEEGNFLAQKSSFEEKYKAISFAGLQIINRKGQYYMSLTDCSYENNSEFSNKLCLTTSNKKQYTIK